MSKIGNNKGKGAKTSNSKKTTGNWFSDQQKLKSNQVDAVKTNDFEAIENAPILEVQLKSNRDEEHFKHALSFALSVSSADSTEIQTIHLNMKDELVFNMPKDESFKELWEKKELMLLVEFPRNWKTMPITLTEDDEDEYGDLKDPEERFDYLYENGMALYQGR